MKKEEENKKEIDTWKKQTTINIASTSDNPSC